MKTYIVETLHCTYKIIIILITYQFLVPKYQIIGHYDDYIWLCIFTLNEELQQENFENEPCNKFIHNFYILNNILTIKIESSLYLMKTNKKHI